MAVYLSSGKFDIPFENFDAPFRIPRNPSHTHSHPTKTTYAYNKYRLGSGGLRSDGNAVTVGERSQDDAMPLLGSGHDYRVLVPSLIMETNRNRAGAVFDILGHVIANAIRGKPEDDDGDNLRRSLISHCQLLARPLFLCKRRLGLSMMPTHFDGRSITDIRFPAGLQPSLARLTPPILGTVVKAESLSRPRTPMEPDG
jgi:hypothetical protein